MPFFLYMILLLTFAALSTIIAVFENIIAFDMDLEDFIVSNNLLSLGSLGYVLFLLLVFYCAVGKRRDRT